MQRVSSAKDHTYVSLLETHGEYNGTAEFTNNAKSNVASLSLASDQGADSNIDLVTIVLLDGKTLQLAIARDNDAGKHSLTIDGEVHEWTGAYSLILINQ